MLDGPKKHLLWYMHMQLSNMTCSVATLNEFVSKVDIQATNCTEILYERRSHSFSSARLWMAWFSRVSYHCWTSLLRSHIIKTWWYIVVLVAFKWLISVANPALRWLKQFQRTSGWKRTETICNGIVRYACKRGHSKGWLEISFLQHTSKSCAFAGNGST